MSFILEIFKLAIITMNFITFPFLNALNESRRKNGLWVIFGESWSSEKSLPSLGIAVPLAPDCKKREKIIYFIHFAFVRKNMLSRAGLVRGTAERLRVNIIPPKTRTYVRD